MDLVSQIIATKDSVEVTEVQKDLDGLSSSAELLNSKMNCELNDPHKILLGAIFLRPVDFAEYIQSLLDSGCHLENRIKELNSRNGLFSELESETMLQKIEDITATLLHLQAILSIESLLGSVENSKEENTLRASEDLMKAKALIYQNIRKNSFPNFFKHCLENYIHFYNDIKVEVIKNWNDTVIFKKIKIDKKTISSSLSILNMFSLKSDFKILQLLKIPFEKDFKEKFLNDILIPVLNHTCSVKIQRPFDSKIVLTVYYSNKSPKMCLEKVIDCLIIIFNLMNTDLNLQSDVDLSFTQSLGLLCSNDFISQFIQLHLFENLDADDDSDYIISLVIKLNSVMTEKGFLLKNNKLNDFISKVTLSRKNIFLKYNQTALDIIEKNLFDMKRVMPVGFSGFRSANTTTVTHLANSIHTQCEWLIGYDSDYLSNKFQIFPECQISKSIDELVKLIEEIVESASACDYNIKANLLISAHQIVSNYVAKSQSQPSTPLHSALVFNNSAYLMISLVYVVSNHLNEFSTNSFISELQDLGFSALNQQVLLQQSILSESLHKSGLEKINKLEESADNTESIINDCLKQLASLQNIWSDVLHTDIYCMMMGYLCNVLIDEMLSMISSSSNQSGVNVANRLHSLTSLVSQKIVLFFKENHPVEKFVKNLSKLNETVKLLSWTLPTVMDRWDKGMGSLATHFSAHQLKALIIAVHPQSDIRDQTLALIV